MTEEKVMNRWLVVAGAVLIQLALGAIYAWSVFTPYLLEAPYNFTKPQTQLIFGIGLATFALVMIVAGRMQAKFTPRLIAIAGGLVLGAGYILAGLVGPSLVGQIVCIGVVGGAGIGLAYVVPIAVGVKWFPDKKGMVTGLAVAGFGFGALIWVKLAGSWGGLLNSMGLPNVFMIYGIAFAVFVLVGSTWMVNPPAGYVPAGWTPPEPSSSPTSTGATELTDKEMLRTWQFYALWLMFLAGAMAGLMVIGCIKLFGIDALQSTGMEFELASAKAGTAMAVFYALANGLGRIIWGTMSDKIGRKGSLALMFAIQGVVMLCFYKMGFNEYLLYFGAAAIGFNFGGNFALFPAATADFFGNKSVGLNYGWVFTAYGVGGIIGPFVGGYFGQAAKGAQVSAWMTPFLIAGVACLAAAVVALLLKPPKSSAASA